MSYTTHTWTEIQSQPQIWPQVLETVEQHAQALRDQLQGIDAIVVTGCGSTYYLALAAAALFQRSTAIPARGVPASEIWLDPAGVFATNQKVLLVAVSRSGTTTETINAIEKFKELQLGSVLTLTCYPGRKMPSMGDLNILFPMAQEESVAQTRAFSSLYLACAAISALWGQQDAVRDQLQLLAAQAQKILDQGHEQAKQLGQNLDLKRVFFLGSAERYGLACEISLKMKEMSLSDSEPFHFLEFRHGPQSMAGPEALIIALLSARNNAKEQAVINEMRAFGATVISIGPNGDIAFDEGLDDLASGALYLPFGQMLAYERAITKGLNPDRPHNLTAVVQLDA